MARFGSGLRDSYGTTSLRAGYQANSVITSGDKHGWRWSVFGGADGYALAHYIPLDGNTFGGTRSVDREDLVGSFSYGLSFTKGDFSISFVQTAFTKLFRTQSVNDRFATLSFGWKF